MGDSLATYLHDHLAASTFAIDLLQELREHHPDGSFVQFASSLLGNIEEDRNALQKIVDRVGKGSVGLKEAGAWLAEKVTRPKLSYGDPKGLGTFQAVETLALGILGKVALWRTLMVVAETDDRLRDVDLQELLNRAQAQHATAEKNRLLLAREAFS
jgi:hypothetical protein